MPADQHAEIPAAATLPAPRNSGGRYAICLVCLGNICRSPMAEVVVRRELAAAGLAGRVSVESAGTGDWHVGGPMDRRARDELTRRELDGASHRARQIRPHWLDRFDLLVVMDQSNLRDLRAMAGRSESAQRIRLMRSFDPASPLGAEVPDPYNGTTADYATAFDLVAAAARGLVAELAQLLRAPAGG